MTDRQPTRPGRVHMEPIPGESGFYTMTMADEPYEGFEGTEWKKANVLTDETAAAIGEGVETPNDAFRKLAERGGTGIGQNLLINGALQIWQRGTTITNPVNTYIADRLKIDGNGTFRAKLGADNKPIGGAILTGNIDCRYLMEHIDFEWLDGRELTFSYSVDGHVTSNTFIANVGNCPFDGEGRRIAAFSPGAGELDWFNLDIGDRAMPFTPRPIAEELDLCQRYFEKSYDVNVAPGTSGADGGRVVTVVPSNNVISFQEFNSTSFKVSKRVPPTVAVYSILGVPNSVSGYGHSAMPANSGLSSARGTGGFVAFTSVALTTSNTMLTYHYTADAEL